MQTEKPLMNDPLRVSEVSWKFHIPTIYEKYLLFNSFCYLLLIPVFVICVEAIIYLLSYNLHDCTFNLKTSTIL